MMKSSKLSSLLLLFLLIILPISLLTPVKAQNQTSGQDRGYIEWVEYPEKAQVGDRLKFKVRVHCDSIDDLNEEWLVVLCIDYNGDHYGEKWPDKKRFIIKPGEDKIITLEYTVSDEKNFYVYVDLWGNPYGDILHKEYIDGTSLKYVSIESKKSKSRLNIYSNPINAEVYIDDVYIGKTPIENYQLEPGLHKIKIYKEGYKLYQKTISIKAGELRTIDANLEKIVTPHQTKNLPPVAKISLKNNEIVVYEGVEVVISALPSYDPDGRIVSYEWIDENGCVISTDPILRMNFPEGVHKITLRVTDDKGSSSELPITIRVLEKPKPNLIIKSWNVYFKSSNTGLIRITVANIGKGDAYDIRIVAVVPDGITISYLNNVYESGSVVLSVKDILRSGDTHTIQIGFKLLDHNKKIIPVTVVYRDDRGNEKSISQEIVINGLQQSQTPTPTPTVPGLNVTYAVGSLVVAYILRRNDK